jgi:hypothetical protein
MTSKPIVSFRGSTLGLAVVVLLGLVGAAALLIAAGYGAPERLITATSSRHRSQAVRDPRVHAISEPRREVAAENVPCASRPGLPRRSSVRAAITSAPVMIESDRI